jgi:hypothetical protein
VTTLGEDTFAPSRRRPPRIVQSIDELIVALLEIRTMAPAAYARMTLAQNGFPVGGSGGGSGISNPTAATATALADGHQRDHGHDALVELRKALEKAQQGVRGLHIGVESWQPRRPSERDLEDTDTITVECCVPCHGHRKFAAFYIHSDVKGNLPCPMALCRWHYDWVRKFGTLPNSRQVEDHHIRGKNRVSA